MFTDVSENIDATYKGHAIREITAVTFEILKKHLSAPCGKNAEFVAVKLALHIVNYWALKGEMCTVENTGETMNLLVI